MRVILYRNAKKKTRSGGESYAHLWGYSLQSALPTLHSPFEFEYLTLITRPLSADKWKKRGAKQKCQNSGTIFFAHHVIGTGLHIGFLGWGDYKYRYSLKLFGEQMQKSCDDHKTRSASGMGLTRKGGRGVS